MIAKKFESQVDTKEEWYGTEYKLEKIPQEKLQVIFIGLFRCRVFDPGKNITLFIWSSGYKQDAFLSK